MRCEKNVMDVPELQANISMDKARRRDEAQ